MMFFQSCRYFQNWPTEKFCYFTKSIMFWKPKPRYVACVFSLLWNS